jgi:oxygen-independent coproporphyrinogen-3 oxidase
MGILKAGVNRVSIGIQSWHDGDLKMLNRRHDSASGERAIANAISAGFENVTVDLIYGLPGLTQESWGYNLDKTLSFDIKHISAYHLTVEPGTVFGKMKEQGKLSEPDDEESNAQFSLLIEKTAASGFIHYEISNFGKEGYFSRHNTNYWKQVPYLGLGPSAHSFNGFSRQWNNPDIAEYKRALPGSLPPFGMEELDIEIRFNEYIMTSLRTMWGADLDYIEKTFEKEMHDYVINTAARFIKYGMLRHDKKTLVLTDQGKLISDNIIAEFMMTR